MRIIKCRTREEWLVERMLGIGGSDITVSMGETKYSTLLDVYNSKIGIEKEITEEQKRLFLRGHILEKSDVEWYNETNEKQATHLDNEIWVSDENEIFRYSPDGIIEGGGLLECKSHANYDTEPNSAAYAQLQWGLGISGLDWGVIVIINSRLQWYGKEFGFDEDYFEKEKKAALELWNNHIVPKEPPPMMSAYDAVMLYPSAIIGKTTQPPENYAEMKLEYKICNQKIKDLTDKKNKITDEFKMSFEDAETMLNEDGEIIATYTNSVRKAFEVKESTTRRLNLKIPRNI